MTIFQVLPIAFVLVGIIKGLSVGHYFGPLGALLGGIGGGVFGYLLYVGLVMGFARLMDRASGSSNVRAEDEPGADGTIWPPAPKRGE